jgi:hypothetical protein
MSERQGEYIYIVYIQVWGTGSTLLRTLAVIRMETRSKDHLVWCGWNPRKQTDQGIVHISRTRMTEGNKTDGATLGRKQ